MICSASRAAAVAEHHGLKFVEVNTNLDRDSFPPAKLKKMYHQRWGIETAFRDLKHTIGLEHFHSKRAEFIAQEVFARLILYNLCELVASHAAIYCRLPKLFWYLLVLRASQQGYP